MAKVGRKRKHVRVEYDALGRPTRVEKGGTEIGGLSFDAPNKTYYTRKDGKKKNLGRDLATAIAQLRGEEPVAVKVNLPWIIVQDNDQLADNVAEIAETARALVLGSASERRQMADAAKALPTVPAKQALSTCVVEWQEWKEEQGRRASYVDETVRQFNEFVAVVGDKPINQLNKADFVAYERHLNKNAASNDWFNRRRKALRTILNHVWRKTEYPVPDAWHKWFTDMDGRPTATNGGIKKGLPAELFRSMLALCDVDAAIDVEDMPKETQQDKARRNRAYAKKRNGVQWRAILSLSLNCGFRNDDVCQIEWGHLRLGGKLSHVDFPNDKADWRTGTGVPRVTPLLPSVIAAFLAWRDYEDPNRFVFRNDRRAQWAYDKFGAAFNKYRARAQQDDAYTFAALRKSPGSAARAAGLPDWMVQAVLGHVSESVAAKHYIEDPAPELLLPIVNAIGMMYFDGEQVTA